VEAKIATSTDFGNAKSSTRVLALPTCGIGAPSAENADFVGVKTRFCMVLEHTRPNASRRRGIGWWPQFRDQPQDDGDTTIEQGRTFAGLRIMLHFRAGIFSWARRRRNGASKSTAGTTRTNGLRWR
jgi:hypothetical protein